MNKTGLQVQAILAGCILFAVAVSVSATCRDLENCYANLGSPIPTGQDYLAVISFFCQTKDHLLTCYDKFQGCATYNTYLSLFPNKADATKRMTVLCSHRSAYNKAVECVIGVSASMSQADLQKSYTCAQNLLQFVSIATLSRSCTLLDQLTKCSPLMKKTLTCTVDLMVLLTNNGINVPCMDFHRSLSSGNRLGACSFILMTGWLISFITKRF